MTKQKVLRAAAFVLLSALMISGLTWLLRDRTTTLSTLYSEPDNTVDVFVVGSSHVNGGVIPGVLWREYGVSAHNVYSWSQPIWISYHYILEGLKTQQPAVVVLDLYGLMYGNSIEQPKAIDEVSYLNSFSIDPGWNLLQMIGTVDDCGIDLRKPADFLPLTHYHTRWKILNRQMFTYDPHSDPHYLKGYGLLTAVAPQQQPDYPATDQRVAPYETAAAYLDKIVALSQKEDFKLVFLLTPYCYQPGEPAIYNWVADYAAQNGIAVLNHNADNGRSIGLDWTADFSDKDHLNISGALKLTRDLGQLLTNGDYALRSPEQLPNRAQLDLDAEKCWRAIQLDAALSGSFAELQAFCAANGLTLLPDNAAEQTLGHWTVQTGGDGTFYITDLTGGEQHTFPRRSESSHYLLYDPLLDKPVCTLSADPAADSLHFTDCSLD
ncbi:MAG: hypothetical protein IJ347_09175 [Faecalibacterium sp.]|nr:hypothetical protein [Faecalibacterium sp.]